LALYQAVGNAHQRWRIERDYQILKQNFGLRESKAAADQGSSTTQA
jgi:hypothetical protein